MSVIKKGTDFGATEQVTSTKLDNLVDNASFTDTSANAVAYTGSTGTCLNGGGLEVTSAGQLQVKDAGITSAKLNNDAVITTKITDLNVTTAKIAADAITTAKIADDVGLGGNPTTTTQAATNNTTRIATTAFVNDLLATFSASAPSGDGMSNSGSVTLPGGLIIKYGKNVDSTSDDEQTFTFPSAFPNNHFVTIPTNAKAGGKAVFPITSILDASFKINRSDDFNNPQSFHFISIGN
tara:strand:- start:884 stop:1597 length:714 start_codon:yes stop_codon:yes gene_type:complete